MATVTASSGFGLYGDLGVYYSYWAAMHAGAVPYHGLLIEYPPVVVPIIYLAGLLSGSYSAGFTFLTSLAVVWLLWHVVCRFGWRRALALAIVLLPLAQFVFFTLEIFPALALFIALWQLQQKRYRLSAVSLAVATLLKAYPGLCLLVLVWALPKAKRRDYVGSFAAALGVVVLPLALWAPQGLWHSITYHTGRPVEILSSPATIGWLGNLLGWSVHLVRSHSSWALAFPHEPLINLLSTVLLALSLIVICWATARGWWKGKPVAASIAILLAFIFFFKVGSPQYLVVPAVLLPLAYKELGRSTFRALAGRLLLLASVVCAEFMWMFGTSRSHVFTHQHLDWLAFGALLRALLLIELLWFIARLGKPAKAVHREKLLL